MNNYPETLSVAVIGAGRMAREHIRAFRDVPGIRITGIHSRTYERAEALAREFSIPHICGSVKELYNRTRADIVIVAVSVADMESTGLFCLEYPWRLFVEKPPAHNLDAAENLNRIALDKQSEVFVGLNRRFLSSTQAALTALSKNDGPRHIHVLDRQNLREAAAAGHPEIVVSHWMYANSIHLADYLTLFGRGEVLSVTHVLPWHPDSVTPAMMAKIDFSSGDTGIYEGIWQGPGPWAVTITTPLERWEMRPLEQATLQRSGERGILSLEISDWDSQFKPGFRLQAEEVVKAVRGEHSTALSLDEALKTMRLIRRIFDV
jgi:predicted dehydrogenase